MSATSAEALAKASRGDRVQGKVAIVTGAGSSAEGIGNGRAVALLLARQGAKVCVADLNEASATETAAMIEREGGEALVVQGDVSQDGDCAGIVRETAAKWGRIDVLVNNVGTNRPRGDALELDLDAWDRGMQVNVKSVVMMVRHAAPEMKCAGGGSIVNISSIAALNGGYPHLFYATSKAAVIHLTRTMAGQHGADGIRVNCVAPGFVYTPMVYGPGLPEGVRETRRESSALKTEGTAWDVAYGVLYLVSDEARWVTSVVLPIDAGASSMQPYFEQSARRLT